MRHKKASYGILLFLCLVLIGGGAASAADRAAVPHTEDSGTHVERLQFIPTTKPAVIFTFGGLSKGAELDGILTEMAAQGMRGTFFVTERELQRNGENIRRIVAAGNGLLKEGYFRRRCEQIAAGGRNDVVSRSAEQSDIAHDALTAQVVFFGECRSTHRFLAFGELRENVGSSRVVLHGLPPEMLFSQYNSKRFERKRAFFCDLFIILQSKGGKG